MVIAGERFTYFDYGPKKNLELYGTPHAAEYNLSLVTTPVFLVSADKDDFAPPAVINNQDTSVEIKIISNVSLCFRMWLGWHLNLATCKPQFGWTVRLLLTVISCGRLDWPN